MGYNLRRALHVRPGQMKLSATTLKDAGKVATVIGAAAAVVGTGGLAGPILAAAGPLISAANKVKSVTDAGSNIVNAVKSSSNNVINSAIDSALSGKDPKAAFNDAVSKEKLNIVNKLRVSRGLPTIDSLANAKPDEVAEATAQLESKSNGSKAIMIGLCVVALGALLYVFSSKK